MLTWGHLIYYHHLLLIWWLFFIASWKYIAHRLFLQKKFERHYMSLFRPAFSQPICQWLDWALITAIDSKLKTGPMFAEIWHIYIDNPYIKSLLSWIRVDVWILMTFTCPIPTNIVFKNSGKLFHNIVLRVFDLNCLFLQVFFRRLILTGCLLFISFLDMRSLPTTVQCT